MKKLLLVTVLICSGGSSCAMEKIYSTFDTIRPEEVIYRKNTRSESYIAKAGKYSFHYDVFYSDALKGKESAYAIDPDLIPILPTAMLLPAIGLPMIRVNSATVIFGGSGYIPLSIYRASILKEKYERYQAELAERDRK